MPVLFVNPDISCNIEKKKEENKVVELVKKEEPVQSVYLHVMSVIV
jgi:hypothetical protein